MEDQGVFNSLRTDPTGDRLGNSAMGLENKVPVSKTGIAPRAGTSLYSHYEMTQAGRQVFTDGLLDALGNGVGVFCVSRASLDDDTIARAFYAHYPGAVSSDYNSITGSCSGVATFTSPTWTDVNSNPAFPSGQFVTFMADGGDGFLYLISYVPGGSSVNSVWRSADGINWVMRNSGVAFGTHFVAAALVLMAGALYTFGGSNNGSTGRTYKSTDGGATWSLTESHAIDTSWGARTAFGSCTFDGKLWIAGGVCQHVSISDSAQTDAWSSPDGVTWTQVTASAPWGTAPLGFGDGRESSGLCATGSVLVLIAGVMGQGNGAQIAMSDVWSSPDGLTWTQINAGGDFPIRAIGACFAPNGTPMFYGGDNFLSGGALYDDLWVSADGGITWTAAFADGDVTGAGRFTNAFTLFNDAMWISNGLISNLTPTFAHDVFTTPISVSCIFP